MAGPGRAGLGHRAGPGRGPTRRASWQGLLTAYSWAINSLLNPNLVKLGDPLLPSLTCTSAFRLHLEFAIWTLSSGFFTPEVWTGHWGAVMPYYVGNLGESYVMLCYDIHAPVVVKFGWGSMGDSIFMYIQTWIKFEQIQMISMASTFLCWTVLVRVVV